MSFLEPGRLTLLTLFITSSIDLKLIVTILISKWVNGKQNNVNPACFPSPPQSLSSSLESRSDRNPLGVPFLVAHVQHPEKPHPFLVAPSLFKGPIIVIPEEKPVIIPAA